MLEVNENMVAVRDNEFQAELHILAEKRIQGSPLMDGAETCITVRKLWLQGIVSHWETLHISLLWHYVDDLAFWIRLPSSGGKLS